MVAASEEQDPMVAASEEHKGESSACDIISQVLYGIVAQGVWLLLGGVVGFLGPFAGVSGATAVFGKCGVGFFPVFFLLLTIPACALVSGGVAFACLVSKQSASNRIKLCALVNCGLFALLAAWAFFEMYESRPGGFFEGVRKSPFGSGLCNDSINDNNITALPSKVAVDPLMT
ncbi:unnamed protein product [Polarella glacialis]|uniref:Uncharacterized protein n=1 Tax=Polarella glacialis TaxID=89957 RepID=A0A813HLA1_POLGL|nr:unnamed protein product [Polarella glacialis]